VCSGIGGSSSEARAGGGAKRSSRAVVVAVAGGMNVWKEVCVVQVVVKCVWCGL